MVAANATGLLIGGLNGGRVSAKKSNDVEPKVGHVPNWRIKSSSGCELVRTAMGKLVGENCAFDRSSQLARSRWLALVAAGEAATLRRPTSSHAENKRKAILRPGCLLNRRFGFEQQQQQRARANEPERGVAARTHTHTQVLERTA